MQDVLSFKREDATTVNADAILQGMTNILAATCAECVLLFEWRANCHTLMVKTVLGIDSALMQNVGLQMDVLEPGFEPKMLAEPNKIPALQEFVRDGLGREAGLYFPLLRETQFMGLILVVPQRSRNQKDLLAERKFIELMLNEMDLRLQLGQQKALFKKYLVHDIGSGAYNLPTTLQNLKNEVSRARRLLLPLSLIHISLDNYFDLSLVHSESQMQSLLERLCAFWAETGRLNDLLGRISADRFALALPHTSWAGAMIRAERILQLTRRLDLSAHLGAHRPIVLSLGVGEYPRHAFDVPTLIERTESALLKARCAQGKGKVQLASAPQHFEPDFFVKDEEHVSANACAHQS